MRVSKVTNDKTKVVRDEEVVGWQGRGQGVIAQVGGQTKTNELEPRIILYPALLCVCAWVRKGGPAP